jgi:hypothetical protein
VVEGLVDGLGHHRLLLPLFVVVGRVLLASCDQQEEGGRLVGRILLGLGGGGADGGRPPLAPHRWVDVPGDGGGGHALEGQLGECLNAHVLVVFVKKKFFLNEKYKYKLNEFFKKIGQKNRKLIK